MRGITHIVTILSILCILIIIYFGFLIKPVYTFPEAKYDDAEGQITLYSQGARDTDEHITRMNSFLKANCSACHVYSERLIGPSFESFVTGDITLKPEEILKNKFKAVSKRSLRHKRNPYYESHLLLKEGDIYYLARYLREATGY